MVLENQMLRRSQRIRDKQNKNMDRISDLPECLLHHILSFIPTKSVVSTSILSKRWKDVWTSMPVLDFPEWWSDHVDDEIYKAVSFMNFMDRLVSLPDDMPSIRRFCLKIDDDLFDESKLNAWISTLVRRKVEELKLIIIETSDLLEFPPCLYTSETLTELYIESYYNERHLNLPESISFPRLKILRLRYIIFRDEKLLSNCPVLEELSLTRCTWMGKIGNLVDKPAGFFNFPVLKELRFSYCMLDIMNDLSISAPALECLYLERLTNIDDCVINIYAPSLLSLVYNEVVARDYVLSSFSSLVDADINISFSEGDTYAASKLIAALSSVKRLKMSGDIFMSFTHADDVLPNLPTFYDLIHLEVTEDSYHLFGRKIMDFLHILPNLESLVFISLGFPPFPTGADDSWTLDLVPQCLLLHLKSVEFRGFCGYQKDLDVVKIFLKNTRVLQRMTIYLKDMENDKVEEVMDQILLFPRGSTSCVVNFWV